MSRPPRPPRRAIAISLVLCACVAVAAPRHHAAHHAAGRHAAAQPQPAPVAPPPKGPRDLDPSPRLPPPTATNLPPELTAALGRARIPYEAASFYAEAVDAPVPPSSATMTTPASGALPLPAPILSWMAETPRSPASVMKLVTSLVALDELGPTYTWSTDFLATAPVVNGVLNGDLVLRGHGDPYLMAPDVWSMVRALRRTGLKTITGDLIVDASFYQLPPETPADFDNRPNKAYNVLPSAVLMNLKQVDLTLRPDGNVAHIETDPPLTSLDITNDVRLTNAPCTAAGRNAVQLQVPDPRTANAVRIAGTYPWRCGPVTWPRTLMTHDQYALGLFTALWREMGGEFGGRLKVAPVPPNAPTLLLWRGNTLAEAIRPMNKSSSNVMARQLLLTLGAERFGAPATPEKGAQAVADYVTRLGLDPIAVHVVNGSGLSREERVTARLLGALLVRGARMPFAPEFISSLSLAGYDGTTRRRFSGVAEAGEMHLKTGHLNDVSALAGYVRARSGRVFVVVGMINTPRVSAGVAEPVLNTMVQWVYTH